VPEEIPTLSRHLLGEGANPMLENTLQVEETINLKNIFVPTTFAIQNCKYHVPCEI
jgi:hypothetical protein